jgi:two-component system phosphate regulon sensor histidine kinase PhoR
VIELRDRTGEADISRAHTDFVANASHELRTPLSSIIGYVETLVDTGDKVDAALTQRFLGTVLREARRMQSLVIDLMSLSQLEADKHDLPSTRIDLAQLAQRVVGEFGPARFARARRVGAGGRGQTSPCAATPSRWSNCCATSSTMR